MHGCVADAAVFETRSVGVVHETLANSAAGSAVVANCPAASAGGYSEGVDVNDKGDLA